MVKNGVPGVRTLSVGDGANDVPMIKAAHVGVRKSLGDFTNSIWDVHTNMSIFDVYRLKIVKLCCCFRV